MGTVFLTILNQIKSNLVQNWKWCRFSLRFWTKWNPIWIKIEKGKVENCIKLDRNGILFDLPWCMAQSNSWKIIPPNSRANSERSNIGYFARNNAIFMPRTLRKLCFHFHSHWMGYDRRDSFSFDFLNQMEFHLCSKSKGNLSPRSYPIQFERIWNTSFLSVRYEKLPSDWRLSASLRTQIRQRKVQLRSSWNPSNITALYDLQRLK